MFDPMTAPERFLPMLAAWVGLAHLVPPAGGGRDGRSVLVSNARARALIAEAAGLAKIRGTGHGLVRFLETATGVRGFAVQELRDGDHPLISPFHIRVVVPPAAARQDALIALIVEYEKPAYVTAELVLGHDLEDAP